MGARTGDENVVEMDQSGHRADNFPFDWNAPLVVWPRGLQTDENIRANPGCGNAFCCAESGWVPSYRAASRDFTYFDIHERKNCDADFAAASHSVVCLELVT